MLWIDLWQRIWWKYIWERIKNVPCSDVIIIIIITVITSIPWRRVQSEMTVWFDNQYFFSSSSFFSIIIIIIIATLVNNGCLARLWSHPACLHNHFPAQSSCHPHFIIIIAGVSEQWLAPGCRQTGDAGSVRLWNLSRPVLPAADVTRKKGGWQRALRCDSWCPCAT